MFALIKNAMEINIILRQYTHPSCLKTCWKKYIIYCNKPANNLLLLCELFTILFFHWATRLQSCRANYTSLFFFPSSGFVDTRTLWMKMRQERAMKCRQYLWLEVWHSTLKESRKRCNKLHKITLKSFITMFWYLFAQKCVFAEQNLLISKLSNHECKY